MTNDHIPIMQNLNRGSAQIIIGLSDKHAFQAQNPLRSDFTQAQSIKTIKLEPEDLEECFRGTDLYRPINCSPS